MATKSDVAKTEGAQLPAGYDLEALKADAQDHNPQMSTADVALPFIVILQALSPQVNSELPSYIEGATQSMFYNNVSEEIFDGKNTGFLFVPCYYERRFVEWEDRDSGGGYITDYSSESDIMSKAKPNDKKRMVLPNGHLIVETAYQYGLMLNPNTGSWQQAVIALASTQLKLNRKWNNDIATSKIPGTDIQAPRWLFPYQMKSWLDSKNNKSWFAWSAEKIEEPVSMEVYKAAKEFNLLVSSGTLNRSAPPADGAVPAKDENGDDIPF